MIEVLADEAAGDSAGISPAEGVFECMKRLPSRRRQLIDLFCGQGLAAGQVAPSGGGRSVHAVYKSLKVLRRSLLTCIERSLAEGCEP